MQAIEIERAVAVFESVTTVARAGGLWSQDTALVVRELARGLGIAPDLPAALVSVTTVNVEPIATRAKNGGSNGHG